MQPLWFMLLSGVGVIGLGGVWAVMSSMHASSTSAGCCGASYLGEQFSVVVFYAKRKQEQRSKHADMMFNAEDS